MNNSQAESQGVDAMNVFCEFTETERQAVAEGLRLLMENGGYSDDYGHAMTVDEIDDLIQEILNA